MYFSFQNQKNAFTVFKNATYLTFEPHVHSHIELAFMVSGGKSRAFADEKAVTIEQGDLFLTFPNQVHYYEDIEKPMNVVLLIASPDICPEFKQYFEKYLPESPIIKNAVNNPRIKNAIELILNANLNNKFSETFIRGILLVILCEFLNCSTLLPIKPQGTDTAKEIINFCYENYMGDISLKKIAEALHISHYYVSHLFAKRLRISFNDYINSLRIRKACELLKTDKMSITEIALFVGYNSVRTFDRCFQKIRDMTPREYRNLKKENGSK
ncbi:MAG: helix-turn-helix domain-containing protein [Ruminococcaceae bacterium]|nr:helix-turn-helix domain-containing protein [Oscillospiraceae bacterium]